jgi:uncharacterized membrane protein YhhN
MIIILIAVMLLLGLLWMERSESPISRLIIKTFLSSLFIIAVIVQDHSDTTYYVLLLLGLIFCLGGDVFLALPQERMFLFGLISFLVGHIWYISAFFYLSKITAWAWMGSLAACAFGGGVYVWLKPHLGSMNRAVLLYIIVITVMVCGACSVAVDSGLPRWGRSAVVAGALCFYFSDLFVARNRFVRRQFVNRAVGLPMYYAGQFLLAFSVGLVS